MLSENDIYYLTQNAISAAYQAGSIIRSFSGKDFKQQKKTGMDGMAAEIVTEVDIKAQTIILETLAHSCKQYDIAILSEENPDDFSRHRKDYFWCIDPIDGTLYFSRNQPGYAVSIALLNRQGEVLISVIHDPCDDKLYSSSIYCQIENHFKPVNSAFPDNNTITIILDPDKLEHSVYQQAIAILENLFQKQGFVEINRVTYGGSVMNAIKVLENSPACYFKLPKETRGGGCVWDFAASSGIFEARSGICSDIHGAKLNLNPEGSLYFNHSGILFATHLFIAEAVYTMHRQMYRQIS